MPTMLSRLFAAALLALTLAPSAFADDYPNTDYPPYWH